MRSFGSFSVQRQRGAGGLSLCQWGTALSLLGCSALGACSPGGQIALRGRAGAGGAGCLSDAGGMGGVSTAPDLAPEPVPDLALLDSAHAYFEISVLDAADRSPIAGATVRTVNDVVYTSDSNGLVAYYDPGLMDQTVFFFPARDGYEFPEDALGNRGTRLAVEEGGAGELLLTRVAGSVVPPVSVGDLDTRLTQHGVPKPAECFGVRVIDRVTKRGVPLVMLSTDAESFVSDSQGVVALCNPDDLGKKLTFAVTSHGYQFAAGSVELEVTAGEVKLLEIGRLSLAERLYRSTGQGVYRDSVMLGLTTPVAEPVLNGRVSTQDTTLTAQLGGRIFWCWGTTTGVAYPFGNFDASCAYSDTTAQGGLDPRLGVNTAYIVDKNGNASALASTIAPTGLPTWLSAMVAVPDANGALQVFASFAKPNKDLSLNRRGLLHFDAKSQRFAETSAVFPLTDFVAPGGQPVLVRHGEQRYVYYGSPLRVPASAEALADPTTYEVFSALPAHGGKVLEHAPDGSLDYGFKLGALATSADTVHAAKLGAEQALDGHLADVTTGIHLNTTGGTGESFSDHRKRFMRLVQQISGTTSNLGELWYVEGDTPMGPWVYARKVVTHDNYGFSGPWFHPYFEQEHGRFVFFDGTYTSAFASAGVVSTPRYDHNQLLYRLDLDEPRLALPVAVYDTSAGAGSSFAAKERLPTTSAPLAAAFFAPDQPGVDTVPVYWNGPECRPRQLVAGGTPLTPPLFYAVAESDPSRASNLVALFDFSTSAGEHAYSAHADATYDGFTRADVPLAYVWPSPISVKLPVSDYLGELLASAGPDQCPSEAEAGRGADVALDATASSSATGSALSFEWRRYGEPCVLGRDPTLALHLAAGVYAFEVRVSDDAGRISNDDVIVQVSERD